MNEMNIYLAREREHEIRRTSAQGRLKPGARGHVDAPVPSWRPVAMLLGLRGAASSARNGAEPC
jgi:hypothetical protein